MGNGVFGGYINDPSVWSLGIAPDASTALYFSGSWNGGTNSYNPETLYLSDFYGTGVGTYSVGSMLFNSGGSLTIKQSPSLHNYDSLTVGTAATAAANASVWNQHSDVDLRSSVNVLGHASVNARLDLEHTYAANYWPTFSANSLDIGDSSWGKSNASLVLGRGTRANIAGSLTVNQFSTAPIGVSVSADGSYSFASSLSAGSFNDWYYSGTALSADGAVSVVTLGSVNLMGASGVAIDAKPQSQITIQGPTTLLSDFTGTLFQANSATLTAGDLIMNGHTLYGQIANVHDPVAEFHLGNLIDYSATVLGTSPVYQVDGGNVVLGDVYGIAIGTESLFDINFGSLAAGDVWIRSSSAPVLANVETYSSLSANSFTAGTNGPTSLKVKDYSGLGVKKGIRINSSSDIALDVTEHSSISAQFIELISGGAVTLNISDDSFLNVQSTNIQVGAPSVIEITPTTTWLDGPTNPKYLEFGASSLGRDANFVVDPGAQIHGSNVLLENANVMIGSSSGDPVLLDGFDLQLGDHSNAVIDNVLWQARNESWGSYTPSLFVSGQTPTHAEVYNTSAYEMDLGVANLPGSFGTLTLGSGTRINASQAEVGTTAWTRREGGIGELNLQDGAVLMSKDQFAIGALKTIDSYGNEQTYSVGGVGTVNLTSGSSAVVGMEQTQSGGYVSSNRLIPLTLGTGSSLNLDPTSSVYVGNPGDPSLLILKPGVVAIGPNGWLNGDGAIRGINFPDATSLVVENDGGIVEPGLSPGTLTIGGIYVQNSGQLVIGVAGVGPADFSRLWATGGFDFQGGQIVVKFVDGYTGAGLVGHTLDFLIGGPIDWAGFNFSSGFVNDTSLQWTLNPNGSMTATPEPASFAALAIGLLALCQRRRARR